MFSADNILLVKNNNKKDTIHSGGELLNKISFQWRNFDCTLHNNKE